MIYTFVFKFEKIQGYSLKLHFCLFSKMLSLVRENGMELKLNPRDLEISLARGSVMGKVGELLGQAPVSLGNAWHLGKWPVRRGQHWVWKQRFEGLSNNCSVIIYYELLVRKLAPTHRGQGETKKGGRLLQIGRWQV